MKDFCILQTKLLMRRTGFRKRLWKMLDEVSNQLPEESDDDAVIREMVRSGWIRKLCGYY